MALLPSNFDNASCGSLIENKQRNECKNEEQNRMNNKLLSPVTTNYIFNGSEGGNMLSLPLQDIEGKGSLTRIQEKVLKLNSAELMVLFMHLPTYACSDGSVESNFRLERNTFIKNSLVSLVRDSMKGTINTISEEIRSLTEDVDIIEKTIFNNVGVVRNNTFSNLNFNKTVQTVIAWCKINYKQKLDSVIIKSDVYNHYSNVCTTKSAPLMSTLLFGKLILIIFPSTAVTKNSKGILQYKNLCKLENVVTLSEVNMDSIAAQFSCKQIYDIFDQIINYNSKRVAKTHMDSRLESQQNNVTFALNNGSENDSYRSGELNGRTVMVHDPLSLLNLSAAVNSESRKKSSSLKLKTTNNLSNDQDLQKLADIIGYRLEVDNSRDIFLKNLKLFKSKGRKIKEYKHPSIKKITAEYPNIILATDLMQLNITPNIKTSEKEIVAWYITRFADLKDKLSQITSTQVPGKGLHKLNCGCCNVNFEVGEGYVRGLDLLRNRISKLKIAGGVITTIYTERETDEIIEIEDEDPVEEPTETKFNRVPVIISTESLAIPSLPDNVQVPSPSSSKEVLPSRSPSPPTVPEIITEPTPTPLQVVTKPTIHAQIFSKPTLPQIVTEPPVAVPQRVPVNPPPLVTFSQIVTKPFESPEMSLPQVTMAALSEIAIESPVELSKSPVIPLQILNNSLKITPVISNSVATLKTVTKPATASSQISTKPIILSSKVLRKVNRKHVLQLKKSVPVSTPSTQADASSTPVEKSSSPNSNNKSMPKMILLSELLDRNEPPTSNIRLSNLNESRTYANKHKTKHVDNSSFSKSVNIRKELENISPPMSIVTARIPSNTQQHISVQSLCQKYSNIIIPKTVVHSDVAPVVVLNSGEVCDWYQEQMDNLKRQVRKYKKRRHKATGGSTATKEVGSTSLVSESAVSNNVLSFRRSKARLMNFCESDSDGESNITRNSGHRGATLNDLLNNPVEEYVSKVTLKRDRMETLDELGNKKRRIFKEHTKEITNEEILDEHLIEITNDIQATVVNDSKVYHCIFCSKLFDERAPLLYHLKIHMFCKTCNKRFKNVNLMLSHLKGHCVINKRRSLPCLKLARVDAGIAEAKISKNKCVNIMKNSITAPKNSTTAPKNNTTAPKNSTTVPANKEIANAPRTKSINRPKLMNQAIKLKELLNSQYNSHNQRPRPSMMPPPKLVPTSRTSQPNSSQSLPALSMPLIHPPPLVTTSTASKSQQNAQPVQLKSSINNNFGKIFLLNNGQGSNYNMSGGQLVINNNENTYLVTTGNQSYINNPISAPYTVPSSFNILSSVTAPSVQPLNIQPLNIQPSNIQPLNIQPSNIQPLNIQPSNIQPLNMQPLNMQPLNTPPLNIPPLNIQPNGLEDHSYHQQRLPLQEENVAVIGNNSTFPPSLNIPDRGGFKLRVKSLHELR